MHHACYAYGVRRCASAHTVKWICSALPWLTSHASTSSACIFWIWACLAQCALAHMDLSLAILRSLMRCFPYNFNRNCKGHGNRNWTSQMLHLSFQWSNWHLRKESFPLHSFMGSYSSNTFTHSSMKTFYGAWLAAFGVISLSWRIEIWWMNVMYEHLSRSSDMCTKC
jgi:hypothetical protein